jgi:antitoxin VapB
VSKMAKAKVFKSGGSQAVQIPAEYRFAGNEVYIRRDPYSGDVILSEKPGGWDAIFGALDSAGFPEDFLVDRAQQAPQARDELSSPGGSLNKSGC